MAESIAPDIHSLAQLLEETLTHDPKDPHRIIEYIRECHSLGVDVLPFDINRSEGSCSIEEEQAVRVGFSLIVPEKANCIKTILAERVSHGAFTSFQDFCERLDIEKIPDDFLLRAIQIGGFDSIEASRSSLLYGRQTIIQHVQLAKEEKATGQFSLFAQPAVSASVQVQLPAVEEWTKEQRIAQEEDALGFSFEECLLDVEANEDEEEAQPDDDSNDLTQAPEADETLSEALITEGQAPTVSSTVEPPSEDSVTAGIVTSEEGPVDSVAATYESPEPEPEEPSTFEQPKPEVSDSGHEPESERNPEQAVPLVREQGEMDEADIYSQPTTQLNSSIPDFEEPPLPPCEFTVDDYDASFPDGIPSHVQESIAKKNASRDRSEFDVPQAQFPVTNLPDVVSDIAGSAVEDPVAADDLGDREESPIPITETEDYWKEKAPPTPKDHEQAIVPPYFAIRLSTLHTTEQTLARLKTIIQQYQGTIPVIFQCTDIENRTTIVRTPSDYSIDASEDCLAAIAAITGYHAITVSR